MTNANRGIGNAAISVVVDFNEDTDRVGEALKQIAAEMREDPKLKSVMLSEIQLWGVDKLDGSGATMAGQIVCTDAGRWEVQREFNRRMKQRFQELGIRIADRAGHRAAAAGCLRRRRRRGQSAAERGRRRAPRAPW